MFQEPFRGTEISSPETILVKYHGLSTSTISGDRGTGNSLPGGAMATAKNSPPVVCFVGRKNAGKTTLMEKVIAGLKAAGYRVAAVKHDAHRFEIDHPGKDSYRFSAAGADTTVISSRDKTAAVLRHREEIPLASILSRFAGEADVVLAEGYKGSPFPKIEVHRKAAGDPLLHPAPSGLIAVATDEDLDAAVPRLDLNDPPAVVAFLRERILGGGRRADSGPASSVRTGRRIR